MGRALKHKKLSTRFPGCTALAAGLAVVSIFGSSRAADSSLSDLDFEKSELRLTLEKVQGENKRLRDELSEREKKLAELRTNIAAITEEGEVFKTRRAN
jgi:hypothetical protein